MMTLFVDAIGVVAAAAAAAVAAALLDGLVVYNKHVTMSDCDSPNQVTISDVR